tara:strand:+ start:379 stop:573 length:195 start_codon:yes stop_codon:yes gene_type:complete
MGLLYAGTMGQKEPHNLEVSAMSGVQERRPRVLQRRMSVKNIVNQLNYSWKTRGRKDHAYPILQ